MKKAFRKFLKVAGWIAASVLLLLIALIVAVRIPSVQNIIVQKAVSFLEEKIGTTVRVRSIVLSFPKKIVVSDLYVEDQSKDTLLFASQISVDVDMWALIDKDIELNQIELSGTHVSIIRSPIDSAFNFDFIPRAFASKSNSIDTASTAAPWKFSMEEVGLTEVTLRYDDRLAGDSVSLKIGSLVIAVSEFNLDKSLFKLYSIDLKNSKIAIQQSPHTKPVTSLTPPANDTIPFTIDFDDISVEQVDVFYDNEATRQSIQLLLGELKIEAKAFSLNRQMADLRNVEIRQSSLILHEVSLPPHAAGRENPSVAHEPLALNIPWSVKLDELSIADNTFQYDNANAPVVRAAVDFDHLLISFLNLKANGIEIKKNAVSLTLKSASLRERSGFSIRSLSTELKLTDTMIDLRRLLVESGYSRLEMNANATFKSISSLEENYNKARIKFNVNKSIISFKDLRLFNPTVIDSLPIYLPVTSHLGIEGSLSGSIDDLHADKFYISALDSTSLSFHGNLKGLPDINKTNVDVTIDRFYSTGYDAKLILPDTLLPDSIRLPRWVEIKGTWRGSVKAPELTVLLASDVGSVALDGKFDFNNTPRYDARMELKELNVGMIFRKEASIGRLNLTGNVKGSGDNLNNLDAVVDLIVNEFQYNQYDYRDLKIKGSVKKYLFSGEASIKDKNLDLDIKGDLDYQEEKNYKLTVLLASADFQALHLSKRPLKARGTMDVNLKTRDFKAINGNMDIRKVVIFNGDDLYMVDSLLFASLDQDGTSTFSIRSDIVSGDFKGSFNLFSLPGVLKQHINHYFSLQDERITAFSEPQNFEFDLTIKNTDLLTEIIFPELDSFTPGKIRGSFNSETQLLLIDIDLAKIKYATTGVDTLTLKITSGKRSLNYRVRLKNLTVDTIKVDDFQLVGRVENDSIRASLQILDSIAERKYILSAVIRSQEDKFRLHLVPGRVRLNYAEWNVPADNYLQFGSGPIVTSNFSISREKQRIAVITDEKNATISLEFQQLELSNLTRIIAGQVPASGVLDGNFKVTTAKRGDFDSRLEIHDLMILGKPWGEVTFTLAHSAERYNLEMLVKSSITNVKATGSYIAKAQDSEFNLDVALAPLDMQTIEPLSFGQLKNSKGQATGNLKITGTPGKPSIRGDVNFKDVYFTLKNFNSSFSLQNEKISFQQSGIAFNNFTIRDERNQEATIRGSILTEYYKEFDFNLRLTSKNFQLLNTTAESKELYYGLLKINTDTKITGSIDEPIVTMSLSPSPDSNVTYVIPQSEKTLLEQKGIVQFVDKDFEGDPFLATLHLEDTVRTNNPFKGIDLTANIELNDKAVLNIIIDPITGDKLAVQGSSTLTLQINPAGDINLSGRYEITKGSYDFSFYKLVKRQFIIEKGSSISWSGDPMKAALDIQASYTVETSPLELISNQLSDQSEINSFKQVLPFLVYLNIKGQLLTPEVSFKLDMPDSKRGAFGGRIYSKLQDINTRESDLNKQVFALLILKRFIADNPLENQAAAGVATTARQSVGRILSDQLNRLGENVKGVQLNVDIKSYEDYTAGAAQAQTRIQLGVQKTLLNDRLVIKLSGNVDIEGQNTNANNDASDYIGDLALEYKLTQDGRLRITGFRNTNYDMISGELTETGTGLIYIKDYNTLKELFKPNATIK